MVLYADDDDSDDEYSDILGTLIDMSTGNAIGGTGAGRVPGTQPPGFSTFSPARSFYLTSNGLGTSPTNDLTLWSGTAGTLSSTVTFGDAGTRPTMADWSPSGASVVYVLPAKVASWDTGGLFTGGARADDDHEFGGSLYTLPYSGNGTFGTPGVLVASSGENNYYPSYSPDGRFVLFDRAAQSSAVTTIDGCTVQGSSGGNVANASCPNDSYSNPAARLMLISTASGAQAVDLENANGSPAASPTPLSNSWPRWSPFVQTYKGNRLLWVTFSSTRNYGVRVRNNLSGMYQCYPPDSYEEPGAAHGSAFDPLCKQPKLWMAAVNLSAASGADPSYPAFYLPFQDMTTHNHTPQWTQQPNPSVFASDAGACVTAGGACMAAPGTCCGGSACGADGTCQTIVP